jgi:hypothetical protein
LDQEAVCLSSPRTPTPAVAREATRGECVESRGRWRKFGALHPGQSPLLDRLLRRRHLLHLLRRSTPRLAIRRRWSSGGGRRVSWLHSC